MLQDNLGSDPGLNFFPLRSAWEGILFMKDALTELSVKILPVIQKLQTPLSIAHVTTLVSKAINPFQDFLTSLTTRLDILKQLFIDNFPPLDRLYSAVSGGSTQPPAAMLALHLKKIGYRLSFLKHNTHSTSSAGLGFVMDPTPPSQFFTQLVEPQSHFKLLSASHTSLKSCIGQHVDDMIGVKFESRLQTVAWVEKHLPSAAYFVFNDVITVLHSLVSSHLTDKKIIEGEYCAGRGQFDNAVAARVVASFRRELSQIFGRVETSSSGSLPSSIHPLPSIKMYKSFNSPGRHSGIK